jgi:mono/diheme cytochrome c family protein
MRTELWAVIALLTAVTTGCGQPTPAPSGDALYRRYCASCHGVTGLGDGPAAAALTPPPTNLTTLKATVPQLMQVIDGRFAIRAHGTSAMPVWGEVFEQMHLDDAYAKRTALLQVQTLADYAATLAARGGAAPPR